MFYGLCDTLATSQKTLQIWVALDGVLVYWKVLRRKPEERDISDNKILNAKTLDDESLLDKEGFVTALFQCII